MFETMLNKAGTAVYQPRSIADWLNRAPGGGGSGSNYGYFGPASSMLSKDITAANPSGAFVGANFFTDTYGAKVWDALNSQTRVYNLIRKVPWGNTTGYRIRSGRNTSTTAVTEVGALPDIAKSTLQQVNLRPVFIVTSLGVSALAQFLGTLEGGIGDALAVQQETAMVDHIKRVNQMLVASSSQRIVAGASAASASTVIDATWATPGDVFREVGQSTDLTVTAADQTNQVTFTGGSTTTDRILNVQSRAGLASIDDVVDVTGRHWTGPSSALVTATASEAAGYGSLTIANRDSNTWSAGNVFEQGAGLLRHLTTGHIDQAIDSVRRNGGEPDLIATGIEQVTRLGTILQANQHFIGEGTFQVKQGGEGTLLGYPTGFQVATYKGIPLFHDFDTATSWQDQANGDAKRGANVYVLDTRFLELPVLFTTQYLESRDYLQNNMLGIKGIFLTSMQLRALDFRKQAKVTDLSDGIYTT